MSERTYNQFCPIAHALDLVGDRWTLLVVRNLFLGPKRFSDLLRGLPGIGTNILTARLKALEGSGLVRSRYLPPPAASSVYELTETGRGLEGVMTALALWGAQSLGAPQAGQTYSPDSMGLIVYLLFKQAAAAGPLAGPFAVRVEGKDFSANFGVTVQGQSITVEPQAPAAPRLSLRAGLPALGALATGQISLREAQRKGLVKLEGPAGETAAFLAGFATAAPQH